MVNDPTKVTWLYIDASNLYGALADVLASGDYIDFTDLMDSLEKDFHINKVKAYGTYLPDEPKSSVQRRKFIGAQNKFFRSMSVHPKVEFHKGYFSKTSKKEKGIDVKLAVDMLKDSYEGSYKCAVIMTGDDDFLYSVECVRKINIPVHLACIGSRFPFGLAHNTNERYVYDLYDYFKNSIQPTFNKPIHNLTVKSITKGVSIISV